MNLNLFPLLLCVRRKFVVPRVLQNNGENESEEESEENEETSEEPPPRNAFCENPAEVRARRERQRAERLQQRGVGGNRGKGSASSGSGEKKIDVVGE